MSTATRFRVNTPKITHQTVDGEVVMINFDSGCYYSLNKSGAELWDLLTRSVPVESILQHLQARYPQDTSPVTEGTNQLLKQLQEEELICEAEDHVPVGEAVFNGPSPDAYETPTFQKYDDMQSLLLIDAIHEVDESGWPVADPATTTGQD